MIWNHSGASRHQSRNKGHSVPRRAEEDQNRDSFSRARKESKGHSIHYSTILFVSLFNKSGENNGVKKRKTQSRIQRTLTKVINVSPAVSHFYGTKYEIWDGFGLVVSNKNFGLGRKIFYYLNIRANDIASALKSCSTLRWEKHKLLFLNLNTINFKYLG